MSAKARLAAVIAALSLVPLQGAAQGLTGLVYSTEDRAPVAGATVRLLDADLMITDTATTDQLGRFTISRPPSGAWVLVASHAGFLGSPHREIELDAADAGVSFMLGLTPLPLEGAEAVVTAERQAVRTAVVTGTVRGGGCRRGCSPVIYVDGMRVGKDDAAAEFLSMSAADIEVVEVFTGPATIPPEYGTADYCAVGIWTKRGR